MSQKLTQNWYSQKNGSGIPEMSFFSEISGIPQRLGLPEIGGTCWALITNSWLTDWQEELLSFWEVGVELK